MSTTEDEVLDVGIMTKDEVFEVADAKVREGHECRYSWSMSMNWLSQCLLNSPPGSQRRLCTIIVSQNNVEGGSFHSLLSCVLFLKETRRTQKVAQRAVRLYLKPEQGLLRSPSYGQGAVYFGDQ